MVLLNINGLLVHRTSERINFIKLEGVNHPTKHIDLFKHKANFHYLREGNLAFLRSVMSHPRVKFAFYSTIMRQNITPIISYLFDKDMLLLQEHMMALFDQEYNRKAPEITGERWGYIRDLSKVWASTACKNLSSATTFGPSNTLMLETDEINVYECHKNSLIVDRYEREDVWPTTNQEHRDQF